MIQPDRPLLGWLSHAALLFLLPPWLGMMGEWDWRIDLLSHFRWQYLVVSVMVLTWAAWRRERVLLAAAVLTALLNAALIGRLAWSSSDTAITPGAETLNVVSFNVLRSNQEKHKALTHLLSTDADVILLVEVDQAWLDGLAALRDKYPYGSALPRNDNFGVALFSRIPLNGIGFVDMGATGRPSVEARLEFGGHELLFIGIHTMPPIGARNAAMWHRQLNALAHRVSLLRVPVLLAGDFNATPWSVGMRILTDGGLGFRSLLPPSKPTWSVRSPFAIPIDHVLVTDQLAIVEREVGPDLGSDHRPLAFSVAWSARSVQ